MKCFIYSSTAEIGFSSTELEILLNRSASKNAEVGITGCLFFRDGTFLQYVEGEPEAIDQLMQNLQKDHRHQINFTHITNIDHRRFPDWHMQWVTPEDLGQLNLEQLLLIYLRTLSAADDPERFRRLEDGAWRMIEALADNRMNYNEIHQNAAS